jgi:hypothetical protein
MKGPLGKAARHENYIEDENSRRFERTGDIIEDSGFIIEETGSKFHDKSKKAEVLLDLNGEDYGILDDGSQGNYTLQSN